MKKSILFFILILLLVEGANGQWYHRKYGVESLTDLPKSALEENLFKTVHNRQFCILFSAINIPLMLGGGILLLNKSQDAYMLERVLCLYFGIISLTDAILTISVMTPLIIIQSNRISQIKKVLGSSDLKLGIINSPLYRHQGNFAGGPALGVSIAFHF